MINFTLMMADRAVVFTSNPGSRREDHALLM